MVVGALWMPPPDVQGIDVPGIDLLVHFGLFVLFGVAWSRCGAGPVTVIAGAGMLALATELIQGFLPWPRTPSGLDAGADLAGAIVGVWAWRRWGPGTR